MQPCSKSHYGDVQEMKRSNKLGTFLPKITGGFFCNLDVLTGNFYKLLEIDINIFKSESLAKGKNKNAL